MPFRYEDQIEQIRRLSDFIEQHFGKRPTGAWLAERVWEPQLPAALAEAGVEYTLVDDSHFLTAGREIPELFGYYIADECGKTVKVIPGLQELRYLLPFGSVEDSVAFLRRSASDHPGGMASMGDDMEKFGAWPHTYEHCFRDGWLDRFFSAMEANFEWLEMVPPGRSARDACAAGPRGPADGVVHGDDGVGIAHFGASEISRASRRIFGPARRSAIPARRILARIFQQVCRSQSAAQENAASLLETAQRRREGAKKGRQGRALRAKAVTHLLRSQCNDAYWHGIFGGLYAPHLRTELWRELVRAETIADSLHHGAKPYQAMTQLDFDADGREEIEITSPKFAAVIKPSDGGTLEVLDFRPSAVTLINSLQRRVEAYHSKLQNAAQFAAKVASIHDQTLAKEPGLEKRLKYDRWARNAFRLLLFAPEKTHADFEALRLEESAAFAGGDYLVEHAGAEEIKLCMDAPLRQVIAGVDPDASWARRRSCNSKITSRALTFAAALTWRRNGPRLRSPVPAVPRNSPWDWKS